MKKTIYIILLALIAATCLLLCACVHAGGTAEVKELIVERSMFSGLKQGDSIDMDKVSVHLTYTDGRYAEVADKCVFELDNELYNGQPLSGGEHCFSAKYPLTDGKYYVASVVFSVAEEVDPDPDPNPDPTPDPQPHEHNFGSWQAEVTATCTSSGTVAHKDCLSCGKHFDAEDNEIADIAIPTNPNAHDFGVWVDGVSATIFSDGVVAHKDCNRCKKHFDGNGAKLSSIVLPRITPTYDDIIRDFSL